MGEDLDTAMAATAMARGLLMLMLRPSHGVASTATDSVWAMVTEDLDTAMAATATARGLLMLKLLLRPSHGTDMVAFTATDSQPMVVTPMESKLPRLPITSSYRYINQHLNLQADP